MRENFFYSNAKSAIKLVPAGSRYSTRSINVRVRRSAMSFAGSGLNGIGATDFMVKLSTGIVAYSRLADHNFYAKLPSILLTE